MKRFKNQLDRKYNNTNINLTIPSNINKKNIKTYIQKLDNKFNKINNDPIITNILYNIKEQNLYIDREKFNINKEIKNLQDLIDLIIDHPIINNVDYNLDLKKLHTIKDELLILNNMIGLNDIKSNILNQILFYIQNFHLKAGINYMHTVIYGPPGTGKTEIAKIIGKIFSKLDILKNGTFRKVVRSDLIAGYLGQTALKTSKVIDEALGGVLFIDEAYALGNSEKRDSFAKECIDTLCEALSNHRDKLMVIIAGYEEELNSCFFNFNTGLKSRFPWILKTDHSSPEQLRDIFIKKIKEINWDIKDNNIKIDFFEKNKNLFKYYGRDIEILVMKTTIAHSKRVLCLDENIKTILTNKDIENGLELFKKHIDNNKEDDSRIIFTMYN